MTTKETAERAEAEAKALRAEAEALKARAEMASRYAETDGEKKEAWEAYEEADQKAGVAELTAKQKRREADRIETESALTAALRVKVRDYLLIEDIATQAARIPDEITFGTLIDEIEKLQYKEGEALPDAILAAIENFDEKLHETTGYYLDTEPREELYRKIKWLYDQAEMDETRIAYCLPAEA